MNPRPRRLIGPEPQHPLQTQRGEPVLLRGQNQIAANHVESGVRVRWKIVPAVTDVYRPHDRHIHILRPVNHASPPPHAGQLNPRGHRNPDKNPRRARSSGNRDFNSLNVPG